MPRALFHFDLAPIPGGAIIASAEMQLTGNADGETGDTVEVYRMLTSWSEGGSTWDDSDLEADPVVRWDGGGDFTSADYDGSNLYGTLPVVKADVTFDAKALVEAWQSSGNTGMVLVARRQHE